MAEMAVWCAGQIVGPADEGSVWAREALPFPETEDLARRHPVATYLARLAPSAMPSQRGALNNVAKLVSGGRHGAWTFPWHCLTYHDMAALRAHLMNHLKHTTANNRMVAVRGVLKECRRLGLMSREAFDQATDVERIKGESLPAGRHVAPHEVAKLMQHLARIQTVSARRDAAAWAILFGTGIRRAELQGLQLHEYDPDGPSLKVMKGKGNRSRIVWLPAWARDFVNEWLEHRGHRPGPLVCAVDKWDNVFPERRITLWTIQDALTRRVEAAGLARITCHDGRRTFVGTLLEAGHDIAKVAKAAGHASPTTTLLYDRRPDHARRDMAASIPDPRGGGVR
jgi:integrase